MKSLFLSITMRMSSLTVALILIPHGSLAVSLALPKANPVPAQAEVSAANFPVKLTLSVYKITLKLQNDFKLEMDYERLDKEHPRTNNEHAQDGIDLEKYERLVPVKVGEPLWIKISVKNIGKNTMFVMDPLFTGPKNFRQAIAENWYGGVTVKITGPNGKVIPAPDPKYIPSTPCPEGMLSKFDPEGTAKAAAWRKQGKTDAEITDLLNKELEEKQAEEERRDRAPILKLEPGETTTTRPWLKIRCTREHGSFPAQVGEFSELWDYHLDSPGIYRIHAIYFDDPFRRSGGKKILVETPPVKITVLP